MATESLYQDVDVNFDLHRLLSGLGRKWYVFLGVLSLCTALGVVAYLKKADTFTSEAKILVKPDKTSSLSGLNKPGLEGLGDISSLGKASDPVVTESEILRSNPLAQATIDDLELKDDEGAALSVRDFGKHLEIKEIPGTDMLRVQYRSEDPLESANVVNQLVTLYMADNVRLNREEASNVRTFLEKELPRAESLVRTIESELRAFREKNKVLALDEQTEALVEKITRVEDEMQEAQIQLTEVAQQIQEIQSKLGMDSASATEATTLSTSVIMQQLLVAMQEVQRELDEERSRYQETHPMVQSLRDQEQALQDRMRIYSAQISPGTSGLSLQTLQLSELDQQLTGDLVKLEVDQVRLMSRIDGLSKVQAQQSTRSQSIPYLEQAQRELERRMEAAQTTYSSLLQRFQEIQLAENQSIGNVRVIAQAALPEEPDSNGKKLLLLGGVVLGALAGGAAALFADMLDDAIKSAEEASELLGYNLLGVIPASGTLPPPQQRQPFELAPGQSQQALMISSAYSNLQANVRLLSVAQEPKTLVFTASTEREGTSGVVANLAASIAESGSKVLIIDANAESAAQSEIWQCQNADGLMDVLGSRVSLQTAIQDITPFLSLLPMSQQNRRPLSMLDFKKIEAMVHELRKQYDFILLDAPSLGRSLDASVLGTFVEGMILVVKPQAVKKQDIVRARQRLSHSSRKVLGVVSNELKVSETNSAISLYAASSNHPVFVQ